jgi:hypothetical protein
VEVLLPEFNLQRVIVRGAFRGEISDALIGDVRVRVSFVFTSTSVSFAADTNWPLGSTTVMATVPRVPPCAHAVPAPMVIATSPISKLNIQQNLCVFILSPLLLAFRY